MNWSLPQARRVWSAGQDLQDPPQAPLADVVARTGWIRTLGGVEAYLALRARHPGLTVDDVHAAVVAGDLAVVPCVRGCIYLVPRADLSLALAIGEALSRNRRANDLKKVGVEAPELAEVGEAIAAVLTDGPLSTHGLRKALPDGVIRSLGDIGKKKGITSTLPPALRELEFAGRIRRCQVDDRLDHERYTWALIDEPIGELPDMDTMATAMAKRFFGWAGSATVDAFVGWTGFGKRVARAAVAKLNLNEVHIEGLDEVHLTRWTEVPDPAGRLVGLPGLDNLHQLRYDAANLAHPDRHELEVGAFGAKRIGTLGTTKHLFERILVVDGEIVGGWAYDPDTHRAESHTWRSEHRDAAEAEAKAITEFLGPLGGGKVFSIDKDEHLRRRLERVRGYGA